MNKFLLKILILCTVITGSFLAIKTEAQNTTSTTINNQLLVVARSEEKKVIINVSNINQKINVDYEIFKGTDKNAVGADRKKVTKIVNSSTQTSTHTFENLTDANNWNVLVTTYKDTDTAATKQTGAATFSIPGPTAPPNSADATLNGSQTTLDTDTTYTPLAPISETLGGCTLPDGTIKENCIDTAEAGAFGKYFNALIRIFIGFCAVLAMIFIVIGGMQYMTSELVSGKEEAKKRIWGAVGGLILALASYAILNTINPQLLDISLSGVAKAAIELQDESETLDMISSESTSGSTQATKLCPEGFENITTSTNVKMFLCKKISQKVKNMIEKAKTENIILAGWSHRSSKRQEELRAKYCGGTSNVFNKNAKCTPPVAYPGTSRHEQALAIDFTCDGTSIQTRDNKCFIWLQRNALSYGLKNFDKEPWHWSFDGR